VFCGVSHAEDSMLARTKKLFFSQNFLLAYVFPIVSLNCPLPLLAM